MERRPFGSTGLCSSVLGFGAMQIGEPALSEAEVARVLHGVLDCGINLIDTARSYGLAEERIGAHLAGRRDEFVLSTKVGYGVLGLPDWSPQCVAAGIDAARTRLRTDVIDIVHLHSCDERTLHSGVIDALAEARDRGKIRVVAYSGDGPALVAAASDPRITGLQMSLNLCDREAASLAVAAARRGAGIIAKRSLLALPWRHSAAPTDTAHAEYYRRFQRLVREVSVGDWLDVALRHTAYSPGVACCVVGGANLAHVRANAHAADCGPLSSEIVELLAAAYARADDGWHGVV